MAARDNVERFSYIYDVVDEGVHKAIKKTDDAIDRFVDVTTKGLTKVFQLTQDTIGAFVGFSSRKVLGAFKAVLFPIQEIKGGVETARDAATGLVEKMAQGARSVFQFENRLAGVFGILKTIAKIGGLGVLLGPFILLIKPFLSLISVITDTLQPALDTITETLKMAFAPVAAALHELTLKLLPHLMKLIAPIVVFLVKAIEQVGKFFDNKKFEELQGIFETLLPDVEKIIDSFVNDFLKPVGGILFETVIKLFKSLVKFAAEFVKTISPYLPRFFSLLQKLAFLIITSLGDAVDKLFKELIKQMPTLVPLIMSMLTIFEKLLPEILKLIPPLTDLAIVLLSFLTKSTVALLTKLLELFIKILPSITLVLDQFVLFIELLAWWLEQSESFEKLSDAMEILGEIIMEWVEDAKVAFEELVRIVGEWVEDLKEVLKFLGLIDDKSAELEKRDQATFDASQKNVQALRDREEGNIERAVAQWKKAGKSEKFISIQEAALRMRMETFLVQQAIKARQEGGHIVKPELALVGEKEPEWIVPDNPQAIMEFLPKMIKSALGRGPVGTVGAPGAAVGMTAEEILQKILVVLQQVAETLAEGGDEFGLPEVLS